MDRISRRSFIKSTVATSTALSLSPAVLKNVRGANDTVRIAVIGLGNKGPQHVRIFHELPGVRVAALCDVDQERLDKEKKKFTDRNESVKTFRDVRHVLDQKDIDAVAIIAPNHWHALMGVWACQAGKDVYIEKPVSHEIWEGRQLIKAARKYKRIMQAGTQARSDEALPQVFEYIHKGNLGKIKVVRGLCYKRRPSIGKVAGPQPIPKTVDYDLFTGPAPMDPLMRHQLHYDWHWQWVTGNGDIGNQGIHEIDMCRWALGQDQLPKSVISIGGRFGYDDDGETANTQIACFDYEPAPLIFEVRGLPYRKDANGMDHLRGIRIGLIIECEEGYFAGGKGGGWIYDNSNQRIKQYTSDGGSGHNANFIEAVRSRKKSDLNAPIEEGHLSTTLSHLANISYRLGHEKTAAEIKEMIKTNSLLLKTFGRFEDHLFANWVDLSKNKAVVGPRLEVDTANEAFISNSSFDSGFWANSYLRRNYRHPFVLPDKI